MSAYPDFCSRCGRDEWIPLANVTKVSITLEEPTEESDGRTDEKETICRWECGFCGNEVEVVE